jgi:hypothetical protein
MDAIGPAVFGVSPDVEKLFVPLGLLAGRETFRATRERDETDRRHSEEIPP